jgi:hypothetical protein
VQPFGINPPKVVIEVHAFPSDDFIALAVPLPTAINIVPFHSTSKNACPPKFSIADPVDDTVHVVPLFDHQTALEVLSPIATHILNDCAHVIAIPRLPLNRVSPNPVHVIPSGDLAILFVPSPTANQIEPFQTASLPDVENMVDPCPVHVVPSYPHIVFVPAPNSRYCSGKNIDIAPTFTPPSVTTKDPVTEEFAEELNPATSKDPTIV